MKTTQASKFTLKMKKKENKTYIAN